MKCRTVGLLPNHEDSRGEGLMITASSIMENLSKEKTALTKQNQLSITNL